MADIELVIKISEETYSGLKDSWILDIYIDNIIKAILDGTPLPKAHGDLIDRDLLDTDFEGNLEVYLEPTIINAPTIIKADKENKK